MKNRNKESGFTLIEISIVMIIIGFGIVGFLNAYVIYEKKRQVELAETLMTDVNRGLNDFPLKIDPGTVTADSDGRLIGDTYNRLPYPASLNGNTAGNNYAREVLTVASAVASGDLIRIPGTGGANVLIGKLPTSTIGISNDYMRDAYGNYVLYAVTEAATVDIQSLGAITVVEEGIDNREGVATSGQIIEYAEHENVLYTVVSMGGNGEGAFAFDGSFVNPCPSGTRKESENCDMTDARFLKSALSQGSQNNFYDDAVIFENFPTGGVASNIKSIARGKEGEDFVKNNSSSATILKDNSYVHEASFFDSTNGTSRSSSNFYALKKGYTIDHYSSGLSTQSRFRDENGQNVDVSSLEVVEDDFNIIYNPAYNGERHLSSGRSGKNGSDDSYSSSLNHTIYVER